MTGTSFFLCPVQEEKENILKILEHHKITYTPTPKTIPLKVRSVGVGVSSVHVEGRSVHVGVRSVGVGVSMCMWKGGKCMCE